MSSELCLDSGVVEAVGRARSNSLRDLLRRSARRLPDRVALIDGDVTVTYAELDAMVTRAASAMHARSLRRGDRVAILSHNCWQYPVAVFAAAHLGCVAVPVNFMLGSSEIAFILAHSGARALVVEDALVATAERALAEEPGAVQPRAVLDLGGRAPVPGWDEFADWVSFDGAPVEQVVVGDDDPIRINYTSGTESRPKGAVLSSRALVANYMSTIVAGEMSGNDVEVHALPLYHCAQLDNFLIPALTLGAKNVILRGANPDEMLATIERHRATKLFCPPTVWIGLLRSARFDGTDLSTLTKGYYGASPMPVGVLKEMQERLPGLRLWNFYGQTEMSPIATALLPAEQLDRPGSAGRPVLNVETQIVDAEGSPVGPGVVGEIVHRSPQATLGYLDDPSKTAEAFAGGWFHSGDLGYLDEDGYLYVVDRQKDMIKSGGENVASREVEDVLYAHPAVAEAAVFGVPHPRWVEAVAAAVVLKPGLGATEAELIGHCRDRLAGFKAPKYITLAGGLPKNPSGKVLKRWLREQYAGLAAAAVDGGAE